MVHKISIFIFGLGLPILLFGNNHADKLNSRYAPYADWEEEIELERLNTALPVEKWWRSPEVIRSNRKESDLPLSGLHLALDPGHIGADWAEIEGRNFRVDSNDFFVREGELVLEVALMVRTELLELGAEVTLLRDENRPLNPKAPEAYFFLAAQKVELPTDVSLISLSKYRSELQRRMDRMSYISGELIERARLVNEEIQPDALISLHINAAPWPVGKDGKVKYELVDSNHSHVLIFGCLSHSELSVPRQREQLILKMSNGSGAIESELGQALAISIGQVTDLPPSNYKGKNAIRLKGYTPYLWARNLLLLRYVECPVVLLEPYIANSEGTYPRIQKAIASRRSGAALPEDDILVEYADAVVRGLLTVYGPKEDSQRNRD